MEEVSLIMHKGPTHPGSTPRVSFNTSEDANRKLAFPSTILDKALETSAPEADAVVVTRNRPCFLSLNKRFLVARRRGKGFGTLRSSPRDHNLPLLFSQTCHFHTQILSITPLKHQVLPHCKSNTFSL